MLWYTLRYLVFCGLVVIHLNCQDKSKNNHEFPSAHDIYIAKEIPVYKDGPSAGEINGRYRYTSEEASALGLDSLELGYDSLQIRIWLGHSLAIKRDVIILKYLNRKWRAHLVTYSTEINELGKEYISKRRQRRVYPRSGWQNLIKNIYDFHLLTLPHSDDLPGYNGCGADGITYYFEWATTGKYRFYFYCNPEINTGRFSQAKDVLGMAMLLEQEFDFTYQK